MERVRQETSYRVLAEFLAKLKVIVNDRANDMDGNLSKLPKLLAGSGLPNAFGRAADAQEMLELRRGSRRLFIENYTDALQDWEAGNRQPMRALFLRAKKAVVGERLGVNQPSPYKEDDFGPIGQFAFKDDDRDYGPAKEVDQFEWLEQNHLLAEWARQLKIFGVINEAEAIFTDRSFL